MRRFRKHLFSFLVALGLMGIGACQPDDANDSNESNNQVNADYKVLAACNGLNDSVVAVMEPVGMAIEAEIPVGRGPWRMTVHHGQKKAVTTNKLDNSFSVIDLNTNTVEKNISVNGRAQGTAFNVDGSVLLTAMDLEDAGGDAYEAYTVPGISLIKTVVLDDFPTPVDIAQSSDPHFHYRYLVGDKDAGLLIYDEINDRRVAQIPLGGYSIKVMDSHNGDLIYALVETENNDGALKVISTGSFAQVAYLQFSHYPFDILESRDGSTLYILLSDGSISVIETEMWTRTMNKVVSGSFLSEGMAFSPDESLLYVSKRSPLPPDTILEIQTSDLSEVGAYPTCLGVNLVRVFRESI